MVPTCFWVWLREGRRSRHYPTRRVASKLEKYADRGYWKESGVAWDDGRRWQAARTKGEMLTVGSAIGRICEVQAAAVMRSGNGRFRADDLLCGV